MWVRWMSEVDSTGGRFYRGSACPSSPAFQQSRGWAWVPGVEITTRLPSLQAACAILGSDSEVSSLKSLGAEADFTAAAPRAQRHKACALPEPPSPPDGLLENTFSAQQIDSYAIRVAGKETLQGRMLIYRWGRNLDVCPCGQGQFNHHHHSHFMMCFYSYLFIWGFVFCLKRFLLILIQLEQK